MLESGTKLGSYEIVEPIGAGGMGEVYKARDTKLDRYVALKVLPNELANDDDRIARFEREAKLLASLNHPNIASIYGFESSALVLELVEGPTLAERIAQGPIPVDEAIAMAKQIADALAAGHDAGVVHRDLKPANVKLTDDGTVKVLDYGLAKALADPAGRALDSELSQSPTLTRGTQIGVILGTAAYMSPEQAKGKRVDKRADIWAFGAVLYEMLTGERPFAGEDVSETLAFVLTKEPDWSAIPDSLSPSLRVFLTRCLAKEPKERVHDIADVRLALNGAFDASSEASEPAASKRSPLPWAIAVVATLLAGIAVWSRLSSEPRPVTRFEHEIPTGNELRDRSRRTLAVSPDGRRFAYNTRRGIYLRSMDQLEAQRLPGTEALISGLYFSPDGESIAFFQDSQLKRLALSGGAPIVICSIPFSPFSAHWAEDDVIYFAVNDGVYRVAAMGGEPERIIANTNEESFDAPYRVPGSDTLLVSVFGGGNNDLTAGGFQALRGSARWDSARTEAVALSSGARTELLDAGSGARFVPPGHLVYAHADGLVAVPFDVSTLRVTGGPVSLVERVVRAGSTASTDYAVSDDGTLFYLTGASLTTGRLAWFDRAGNVDVIETIPASQYQYPRLSPDGDRLLVASAGDVHIYDLANGRGSRLTNDGVTQYLGWTPSGDAITYSTAPAGRDQEIWIRAADGSGTPRQVNSLGGEMDFDAWAPSGRMFSAHEHVARLSPDAQPLMQRNAAAKTTIVMFSDDGETTTGETWLENDYWNHNAVFSPDERYLAYISNETGAFELCIRPFPGPGGQTTVSVGGASEPVWAPTGELFYRRPGDYMMMVVDVSTTPVLAVGTPVELFRGTDPGGPTTPRYTVTADGQRFIMSTTLLATEGSSGHKVVVVENWHEELERRVPSP